MERNNFEEVSRNRRNILVCEDGTHWRSKNRGKKSEGGTLRLYIHSYRAENEYGKSNEIDIRSLGFIYTIFF